VVMLDDQQIGDLVATPKTLVTPRAGVLNLRRKRGLPRQELILRATMAVNSGSSCGAASQIVCRFLRSYWCGPRGGDFVCGVTTEALAPEIASKGTDFVGSTSMRPRSAISLPGGARMRTRSRQTGFRTLTAH